MNRKKSVAEPVRVPDGWISCESIWRLRRGGNDSKGTVPIHAKRTATSCIPIYFGTDELRPSKVLGD